MKTKRRTIHSHAMRCGFTMIELLVVIAIMGILIGMLLPAVQMARESSRRVQCGNHLRQLSLAAIEHEEIYGWYPTGGWSKRWIGLPDEGTGQNQPGGWVYNVLPFLEQSNLHALGGSDSANPAHLSENRERLLTSLSIFHCPSRRGPERFRNARNYLLADPVAEVARNDYAFNGGHRVVIYGDGPNTLAEAETYDWPDTSSATGMSFQRSRVRHRDVDDGHSNTYLLGEKHLRRDRYTSGDDHGDNESMYSGDDRDLIRFTGGEFDTSFRPLSDGFASIQEGFVFGSPHPGGFQMAMCDGSVKLMGFDIAQSIHSRLGNREDGKTVSF